MPLAPVEPTAPTVPTAPVKFTLQFKKVPEPSSWVIDTVITPVTELYAITSPVICWVELYATITYCPGVYAKPVPMVKVLL